MPNNVIVIGGNGLVGSHIIKQLQQDKEFDRVVCFDIAKSSSLDLENVETIVGDITKVQDLERAFNDIDVVIHTASPRHGLGSEVYFRVNVEGTRNVISACQRSERVKKLVFTSSASVVYNGQTLLNAGENLPYCKVHLDSYNETKAIAEKLVLDANDNSALQTIALRPAGIFGPGDMQASYSIYKAARGGKYKFMVGDNTTLFDMTFVDNVAYAHLLAAKNLNDTNSGEAYNITNDSPIYWFDFAKEIYTGLGYKNSLQYQIPFSVAFPLARVSEFFAKIFSLEVTFTTYRMTFLSTNRVYNIEKAKEKLGYKPLVSIPDGLAKTIEWLNTLPS